MLSTSPLFASLHLSLPMSQHLSPTKQSALLKQPGGSSGCLLGSEEIVWGSWQPDPQRNVGYARLSVWLDLAP